MAYAHYQGTPQVDDLGKGEEYELRSPDVSLYDLHVDAKTVGWRAECFEGRGFSPGAAMMLALRRDVDRAHVERLLDQGATHLQVMELLT